MFEPAGFVYFGSILPSGSGGFGWPQKLLRTAGLQRFGHLFPSGAESSALRSLPGRRSDEEALLLLGVTG